MRLGRVVGRGLKWLGFAVGGLVTLIALALVAAAIYLRTDGGSDRVRALVVEKVDEALAGSISVGDLELGFGRLVLHDVRLTDPEGDTVAEIDRAAVAVKLLPLVRKTIHVSAIELEGPRIYLETDAQGSNLSRAIAPTEPKPEEPPKPEQGRSTLSFVLDRLELTGGEVSFLQATSSPPQRINLDELNVLASGEFLKGGESLSGKVEAHGDFDQPVSGPLVLKVEADGKGARQHAKVSLDAAGLELRADVTAQGDEANPDKKPDLIADLEKALIPPAWVQAFAPSFQVAVPLVAKGRAELHDPVASASVEVKAGDARATAEGSFNLTTLKTPGMRVELYNIDFAQLMKTGPRSALRATLEAKGGGRSAQSLDAEVKLTVPQGPVGTSTLGPIRLSASARDGQVTLHELLAKLPGVTTTASGGGSLKELAIGGRIDAHNLTELSRTLGTLTGPQAPPLHGSGALSFEVKGPLKALAVTARGQFGVLEYAANKISNLALTAEVPDLSTPLRAAVAVDAVELRAGPRVYLRPHIAYSSKNGPLTLDASVAGETQLKLTARGAMQKQGRAMTLDALTLAYPEATWNLVKPTHIQLEPTLDISPLALTAGEQQLTVELEQSPSRIKARLDLARFDLAKLPKAFVDTKLGLAGQVDAALSVQGRPAQPDLVAKVSLAGGAFQTVRELKLELDAKYVKERAVGTLAASGAGVDLNARFDAPVQALLEGKRESVKVSANIREFQLEHLAAQLQGKLKASGLVAADLEISGSADDPHLSLSATGKDVRYEKLPPTNFKVSMQNTRAKRLFVRAEATALERTSFIEVRTPYTLGRLIRRPPTAEQAMRAPMEVEADIRALPLPIPYAANLSPQIILGNLTAKANLKGTALVPRGTAKVQVDGLTSGAALPIDVAFTVDAGTRKTRGELRAWRKEQTLGKMTFEVAGPLGAFTRPERAARMKVSAEGGLGPIQLSELQALLGKDKDELGHPLPRLKGNLSVELNGSGSLETPTLRSRVVVEGLGSDASKHTANVNLAYDYKNARHDLNAAVASANGGALRLTGTLPLDISWSALQRPSQPSRTKVSGRIDADSLDLSFLSALSPKLIEAGGVMNGSAQLGGTLAAPRVEGELSVKEGRAVIAGNGELHGIELSLRGSPEEIKLERLLVLAGKGRAELSASLARKAGRFDVQANAKLKDFPIITEDQLAATVSLSSTAEGSGTLQRVDLRRVAIAEAHVELPEIKKKDLQKLEDPEDVVFLRNGVPIKKRRTEAQGKGVGGSGPAGASPQDAAMVIRAVIDAPRNLWIRGKDVNTELGLSEGFRVESAAETLAFGQVKILRGTLEVFGRRFDLQRDATATFGGNLMTPALDVTAKHVNEREQVTVFLKVRGTANALDIEPTSEPALSETEIYTLLATGRRSMRPGSGGASSGGNAAASYVGSLAASKLKSTLSDKLPLDVLSIEAGDSGLEGTKVEAGTYLNERTYVGFTGRVGADPMRGENSNAARLEYQLGKRWSLEAEYGDAKAGGADFLWTKEY